jgi:KipI family sensor histidine kinase inhibitor
MTRPDHPLILPLGDAALLLRFSDSLSDPANRAAIAASEAITSAGLPGVLEVVPNLVSVLVRYEPRSVGFDRLAGEVSLVWDRQIKDDGSVRTEVVPVRFDGPDLDEVAGLVGLGREAFIAAHNSVVLRVLTVGFAPGFLYCGLHRDTLRVPRRQQVRRRVEAGAVLFAAGQTAIASTPMPTGWHVIGHTAFSNFDAAADPPTRLRAGSLVRFEDAR